MATGPANGMRGARPVPSFRQDWLSTRIWWFLKLILIVDDDPACLSCLSTSLREAGHIVLTASNAADAIRVGLAAHPDVLLADILLDASSDGVNVAVVLGDVLPTMDVVFMTGLPSLAIKNLRSLTNKKVIEKTIDLGVLVSDVLDHLNALGPP